MHPTTLGRVLAILGAAAASTLAQAPDPVPTRDFAGRVVDLDGRPIAGVAVTEVTGTAWPWRTANAPDAGARTGADGTYRLHARPGSLFAFAADGYCTTMYQCNRSPGADPKAPVTVPAIALPRAVTVTGRVRGPDGGPIAGATIFAEDLAPSAVGRRDVTASDAKGIFHLRHVVSSPIELRIEADGFVPVRLLPIDRSSPLDVTLERALVCTGTLLANDGTPRAGHVTLAYEDGVYASAQAAADGAFRVAIRPGLRYRLSCFAPELQVRALGDVLEGAADGVRLQLPGGPADTFVEVLATAADGPVREFGCAFDWIGNGADHGHFYLSASFVAAQDGVLRFPASALFRPGTGFAWIRAPGFAERIVPLPGEVADGAARLTVALEPERVAAGVVRDASGAPVAGAAVWALTRRTRISAYSGMPATNVTTGADGAFALRGLAAEDYVVQVAHPDLPVAAPRLVSLRDGDVRDLAVALDAPRRLELQLTDAPEAAGCWLELSSTYRSRGADRLPIFSSGHGNRSAALVPGRALVIDGITAGDCELAVHRLTIARLPHDLSVGLGPATLRGTTTAKHSLAKLHTGTIRGRVRTTELAATSQLLVRAGGSWPPSPGALLAADGTFGLETLVGPQRLEVVDLLTGFALGTADITVAPGKATNCELQVEAGVLDVTIGLPAGATRTAMWCLRLELPGQGEERHPQKQIQLADLRGPLRLVLPPGPVRLGFQRAAGALSAVGATRYVDEGAAIEIDVADGRVRAVTLAEPKRRPTAELAAERTQ